MPGLLTVFRKELADQLGSKRFVILFAVVALAGIWATYVAGQSIIEDVGQSPNTPFVFLRLFTVSSGFTSFVWFVGFLGPLLGLVLGFDAINREHASGTLSRVLSQPLFRDSVINGKFLAGLATIGVMLLAIVLIVGGLGLRMIGIPPTMGEVLRLLVFWGISIIYIAFWMSLAVLFSILFRRVATSFLAGIALWIFFAVFIWMIAGQVADRVVPVNADSSVEEFVRNENVRQTVMRISPNSLYEEATLATLTPTLRTLSPVTEQQASQMIPNPLPLRQSLMVVWPHLVSLIALTAVCFGISYTIFMRREIRAP